MQDITSGIYTAEQFPNDDYHALRHIPGSSTLKVLDSKSPAHFKYGKFTESPALAQGSGIHAAVLEPHDFDNQIACGPDTRRGNAWKEAVEKNPGKIVLPKPDYDKCLHIRDAVWANDHIARLLGQNDKLVEHSAFGEVSGVQCKVRPDCALPSQGIILDLKSAADASKEGFGKAVFNFGYHLQEHMYPRVWKAAGGFTVERFVPYVSSSCRSASLLSL